MPHNFLHDFKNISRSTALHKVVATLFFFLLALAPSGTRYIFRMGMLRGMPVEPGTVSVFGTQLLALLFIIVAFALSSRHEWQNIFRRQLMRQTASIIFAFVAVVVLATFFSQNILQSAVICDWVLLAIASFFAIQIIRPNAHHAIHVLIGLGMFQSVIGLWQFFSQNVAASTWLGISAQSATTLGASVVETDTGRWLRAYGASSHPNVYGFLVALALVAAIAWFVVHKGHHKRIALMTFIPLLSAGLFVSFSRGAFVATSAALLTFFFFIVSHPDRRRAMGKYFFALGVVAAVFGIFGALYSDPFFARITAQGRLESYSLSERSRIVNEALELTARYPIFGVGPGQMVFAVAKEISPTLAWWQYQPVHNLYLLLAAEIGLTGVFLCIALLFFTLRTLWHGRGHWTDHTFPVFSAMVILLFVSAFFDHFLWSSWVGMLLFWLILGVFYSLTEGLDNISGSR